MYFIPTILSGGAGSRLWPVSREQHPKPFIRLEDGQSLLQKAFLRGVHLPHVSEILAVTNRDLLFKTEDEFNEVNTTHTPFSFILEPCGRNTAAAIASAAHYLRNVYDEHAIMLVLPADHLIADQNAFQRAVTQAIHFAQRGKLVTFGIHPHAPETGYGYIEAKENKVLRFIEKPSLEKAQAYVNSGQYFWNAGMFCFTIGTLLQEMVIHCPDILYATQQCVAQATQTTTRNFVTVSLDLESFSKVPENSIDYAILEHSAQVAMIPCPFDWSDVGSWRALSELVDADAQGNRHQGEVYFHDSQDCYVQSPYRMVSTLGVKNLVVIDTPDALLVADQSHAQQVKNVYAQLKAQDHDVHRTHSTVHRPWGTYTILEQGPGFKIKRIVVKPGASLSLQMHHHRSEHWIVVRGSAKVINGAQELRIETNESTYIPAGNKHRLINPTSEPVVIIEVQSGSYLGEDDIVRYDDIYGRVEEIA